MKTLHPLASSACLLACLLGSACTSMNKSAKLSGTGPVGLQVVPVAGQPVIVDWTHAGVSIVGGAVGTAIGRSSAGEFRRELAERLNRDVMDFKPEVILAEECVRLLQDASNPAYRNPVLRPQSIPMPATAELLQTETAPFKARQSNLYQWLSLYNKWRKGPPVDPSNQPNDLTIEVAYQMITLNRGEKVEPAVFLRILDSGGKVVGARYTGRYFDVRPVTLESDPAAFVEDFRKAVHELAKEALTDLQLL